MFQMQEVHRRINVFDGAVVVTGGLTGEGMKEVNDKISILDRCQFRRQSAYRGMFSSAMENGLFILSFIFGYFCSCGKNAHGRAKITISLVLIVRTIDENLDIRSIWGIWHLTQGLD
jgi:hypothetical protein